MVDRETRPAARLAAAFLATGPVTSAACAFEPVPAIQLGRDASAPPDRGVRDAGTEGLDSGLVPEPDAGGTVAECGNGIREGAESCDDRNVNNGDGCTAQCAIQPGWICARDEGSRCYRQSQVTYVDGDSAGCPDISGNGSRQGPFCTIQEALEAPGVSAVIVAPGIYAESLRVDGIPRIELVADETVLVDGETDRALEVSGSAVLTAVGIRFIGGAPGAVRIRDIGSEAELVECEVGPSEGVGVQVTDGGRLTMERSRVGDNTGGGLLLDSVGGYAIKNVVVANNGSFEASFGGVHIERISVLSKFVNNTVTDNQASDAPAGIVCNVAGTAIINTIVWGNRQTAGLATVSPTCFVDYCLLGPADPVSGTNVNVNPRFVAADRWFHLQPDSPGRNAADPFGVTPAGPAPTLDIDGDRRFGDPRVDIGADEVR